GQDQRTINAGNQPSQQLRQARCLRRPEIPRQEAPLAPEPYARLGRHRGREEPHHRPLKLGARFSTNALHASPRSSDPRNAESHAATYASPSATDFPSPASSTSLTPRTASGEFAAISRASASAPANSASCPSWTSLTSPIRCARAASMSLPVNA